VEGELKGIFLLECLIVMGLTNGKTIELFHNQIILLSQNPKQGGFTLFFEFEFKSVVSVVSCNLSCIPCVFFGYVRMY